MVKPNFTIGTVFEDGGLYYEVQAVLPSGDYISKRVDKVPEPEKEITVPIPEPEQEIPIPIPEKTEDKPVKKTEDNPVKRTRTTTRTKNTGGRKKQ
jgi:hypothetical protein|nr:MAG TPA: hypothetical protein [Caudoviricetes sp.]